MAIIITEVDGRDLLLLQSLVDGAVDSGQSIKINQHSDGTIMVKRGEYVWVAPFGKDVTERPEKVPGRYVIETVVDVWDAPHRNPSDWDLEDMAEAAYGEHPDKVVSTRAYEA